MPKRPPSRTPEPHLLTIEQAAEITQTCGRWIRDQVRAENLRAHRFGRMLRIAPDDLEAFIKRHRS
jgi:excisionase family DNA binding protein